MTDQITEPRTVRFPYIPPASRSFLRGLVTVRERRVLGAATHYRVRSDLHLDVVVGEGQLLILGRERRVVLGISWRGRHLGKRIIRRRDGVSLDGVIW